MIIIIALLLSFTSQIFASDIEVKSLRTYSNDDQTSAPVINYDQNSNASITIEFDINASYSPSLNIVFKFCDKNWRPYENMFLSNQGLNTEYNLWYDDLPVTVKNARYHYKGKFPDKNVTFPFSGKWIYYITDSQDNSIIYGSGRFLVISSKVGLNVNIQKSRMEGTISSNNARDRMFQISAKFVLPDSLFQQYVQQVEIIENQKYSYPVIITRNTNSDTRFYDWDGVNRFTFTAKDVLPENEYRQTNLFDKSKYSPPETYAHFEGIETSNFYKFGKKDLNGGSRLMAFSEDYAQYMQVYFDIRPPEEFKGKIFLTGAFNDWRVMPAYELLPDNGVYDIGVELKRGIYDYQYVTGDVVGNKVENIDWIYLEGNYWETNHNYYVLLYYSNPNKGGYDEIIGFAKIPSGGL